VGHVRGHEQLGVVARRRVATGHEQGVVEEVVGGADAEEGRRQVAEVGVGRRDLRCPALLVGHPGQVAVAEAEDARRVQQVGSVGGPHAALAGCATPVHDPEHEVGAQHPVEGARHLTEA